MYKILQEFLDTTSIVRITFVSWETFIFNEHPIKSLFLVMCTSMTIMKDELRQMSKTNNKRRFANSKCFNHNILLCNHLFIKINVLVIESMTLKHWIMDNRNKTGAAENKFHIKCCLHLFLLLKIELNNLFVQKKIPALRWINGN